jgi:hypothetical protein
MKIATGLILLIATLAATQAVAINAKADNDGGPWVCWPLTHQCCHFTSDGQYECIPSG